MVMDDVTSPMQTHERMRWHGPTILACAALLIAGNIYFFARPSALQTRIGQLENVTQSGLNTVRESLGAQSSEAAAKLGQLNAQLQEERGQAQRDVTQASRAAQR